NFRKMKRFSEINMAGRGLVSSVQIIPNPHGGDRKSELFLLGFCGDDFGGRRGVTDARESGERIAKLLGVNPPNTRPAENKILLSLLAEIYRRHLIRARSQNAADEIPDIVMMLGKIRREP